MPKQIARVDINVEAIGSVVGEALEHSYSHRELDAHFFECGFEGTTPQGLSKSKKTQEWIKREGQRSVPKMLIALGKLIQHFMENDDRRNPRGITSHQLAGRERITKVLAQQGLIYQSGGRIFGANASIPSRSLDQFLIERDIPAINQEFERALQTVETDPRSALTAACAITEAFCRTFLTAHGETLPGDMSAKPLWNAVATKLGLAAVDQAIKDMKMVCTGLSAVLDGLACFRTHEGSAHGREQREFEVLPRHARLAVHAAHTLVLFALETWDSIE